MAIDAKVDFMNQLEARLADVITASEMTKTLAAVAEVMDNFQIAVDATAEADMKDDLLNAFTDALKVQGRSGMPVQEVAAILGHEKIDTTMKYVVLNKDDIKSSYRRFA